MKEERKATKIQKEEGGRKGKEQVLTSQSRALCPGWLRYLTYGFQNHTGECVTLLWQMGNVTSPKPEVMSFIPSAVPSTIHRDLVLPGTAWQGTQNTKIGDPAFFSETQSDHRPVSQTARPALPSQAALRE